MSSWHDLRFIRKAEEDVRLVLPDCRQEHDHDCGDAAVRCVLAWHKIKATVRMATPERGTSPEQIESAFKRIGMQVVSGEMCLQNLRHFCEMKRPPIVVVHWPGHVDSHYVVVEGVTSRTVYYHDVADGKCKKLPAEFLTAWSAAGRVGPYKRWAIVGWT